MKLSHYPSTLTQRRCPIHDSELEIDAIRGFVCPACDADNDRRALSGLTAIGRRLTRWFGTKVLGTERPPADFA